MQRISHRPPKKLAKHDTCRLIDIFRSGWEGGTFSWGKLAKQAGLLEFVVLAEMA
jgi:hypothetical protein